jgi:hypothetical protein
MLFIYMGTHIYSFINVYAQHTGALFFFTILMETLESLFFKSLRELIFCNYYGFLYFYSYIKMKVNIIFFILYTAVYISTHLLMCMETYFCNLYGFLFFYSFINVFVMPIDLIEHSIWYHIH